MKKIQAVDQSLPYSVIISLPPVSTDKGPSGRGKNLKILKPEKEKYFKMEH